METVLVHRDKGLGTMDLMTQMDKIYREMLPDEIPWNLEEPPDILVALMRSPGTWRSRLIFWSRSSRLNRSCLAALWILAAVQATIRSGWPPEGLR
jgi:hypothetical protein